MKKYFIIFALIPSLLFAGEYDSKLDSINLAVGDCLQELSTARSYQEAIAQMANWLTNQLLFQYEDATGNDTFFQWVYGSIQSFVEDELISPPSIIVDPSGIISTNNQFDISTGYNYLQQMRMLAEFDRDLLISLNNAIVTSYSAGNTNTIFGVIANNQSYIRDLVEMINSNIDYLCYQSDDILNELIIIDNKIISAPELQSILDNLDLSVDFPTNLITTSWLETFVGSNSRQWLTPDYGYYQRKPNQTDLQSTLSPSPSIYTWQQNFIKTLGLMFVNQLNELSSLNNWLYSIHKQDYYYHDITTNTLSSFADFTTNYQDRLETSLNRKSFFSSYNSQNYENYRDYITNYYLEVASGSQSASYIHTNWFDRIEMLLSALVFSGNGIATNTIDEMEAENKSGELKDHLSSLTEKPQEQLNNLSTAGDGLLDVLGTIQNSFSSASLPNEVVLISFSNSQTRSNGVSDDSIKFSPDSAFYQLLRSLTTLCWVVMGLLVFYHFFIWSAKKIYSLGRLVYEAICFIIGHAS